MSRWFKYLLLALSPLLVFLAVYLAGCIIAGDFYKIPVRLYDSIGLCDGDNKVGK